MEKEKSRHPYIKRFAAFIVDWYLSSILAALPVFVFQSIHGQDLVLNNRIDNLPVTLQIPAAIAGLLVYTLYFCVFPLRNKKGQTPGRRLLDLELQKLTGYELQFKDLFIRDFVGVLLLQGNLTNANVYIMSFVQDLTSTDIIPYYQSFYTVFVLISLGLVFSKKRQTLHDLISKTKLREAI
jgi:uncharacterized RDD family membrane protein YckC